MARRSVAGLAANAALLLRGGINERKEEKDGTVEKERQLLTDAHDEVVEIEDEDKQGSMRCARPKRGTRRAPLYLSSLGSVLISYQPCLRQTASASCSSCPAEISISFSLGQDGGRQNRVSNGIVKG